VFSFGCEFSVLAAVGFVYEDYYVFSCVGVGYVLELLDGGDYNFTALVFDEALEGVDPVCPAGVGHLGVGEYLSELFLQLFAVDEYEDGGVAELWLAFEFPCGEEHGEGLAAALGVPDEPVLFIWFVEDPVDYPVGGFHLLLHGDLFYNLALHGLEDDEVLDDVEGSGDG